MRSSSVLVLAIYLASCGDEPGGADDDDTRPICDREDSYEGLHAVFAEACSAMERCDSMLANGYAFSCRQQCVQAFDFGTTCSFVEEEDDDQPFNRKIEEREYVYDSARGESCRRWLESADCSQVNALISRGELFDDDAEGPCGQIVDVIDPEYPPDGTVKLGEVCDDSYDCEPGTYCSAPTVEGDAEVCSACIAYPSAGQLCLEYQCAAGAYCDSQIDPPLCGAKKSTGSPCTSSQECTSELCYESACFDARTDGEPCVAAQQCASYVCYADQCITPGPEGTACTDDVQCQTNRCYQGACFTVRQTGDACQDHAQCWESCFRGECIARRDQGEACDEDLHCGWNQVCYANVCTNAEALPGGAPCVNEYECASDRCVGGVCIDIHSNGEACSIDEACYISICHQGTCGLPVGEACDYLDQCRSYRCLGGFCVDPKADGDACQFGSECASDTCLDGFCITLGEEGAVCSRNEECREYYFCDPDTSTCRIPHENGLPCLDDRSCRNNYCDLTSNLCGHAASEACMYDQECQGFCSGVACASDLPLGSDCSRDEECLGYCVFGECRELKPYSVECTSDDQCEGGICEYSWSSQRCRAPGQCFEHDDCDPSQRCIDDEFPYTCGAKKADGEACDDDLECSKYCYDYCVQKRPFDAACETDDECVGGLCDNQRCSEPGLCNSDGDCTGDQLCEYSYPRSRCIDRKVEGLGCQDDEECVSGFCSPSSETCKTKPQLGEACLPHECTLDSYCLDGTCAPRKRPGQSCQDGFYQDLECLAPSVCRRGVCESLSLECKAAPIGRMCTLLMACADDAYCDLLDGFTCKARYSDGEACETVLWRANTCFDGSYCDQTCKRFAVSGESCASVNCDPESWCENSTCAPRKYRGESCESDAECLGECEYESEGMRCDGPCKEP